MNVWKGYVSENVFERRNFIFERRNFIFNHSGRQFNQQMDENTKMAFRVEFVLKGNMKTYNLEVMAHFNSPNKNICIKIKYGLLAIYLKGQNI